MDERSWSRSEANNYSEHSQTLRIDFSIQILFGKTLIKLDQLHHFPLQTLTNQEEPMAKNRREYAFIEFLTIFNRFLSQNWLIGWKPNQ